METDFVEGIGLGLSFLAAFIFSLFHVALLSTSKISISRYLEDKDKAYRLKILEIYDDLRISVEIMRALFFIAFLIYLYVVFPSLILWPLSYLLIAFTIYLIFFDLAPRLINSLNSRGVFSFFLSTFKVHMSSPNRCCFF